MDTVLSLHCSLLVLPASSTRGSSLLERREIVSSSLLKEICAFNCIVLLKVLLELLRTKLNLLFISQSFVCIQRCSFLTPIVASEQHDFYLNISSPL